MNREIYIEKREEVYIGYLQKSPCNSCGNKTSQLVSVIVKL